MKKFFISSIFLLQGLIVLAAGGTNPGEEINGGPINVPSDGIIDGVFIQQHIPTKRMIPYEYVREADAMWSKRVWEYIDLREKINLPLYYPLDDIIPAFDTIEEVWVRNATRWSLWTTIRNHIMNGDLNVFSPYDPALDGTGRGLDGDQLKYPVLPQPGLTYYTDDYFRAEMKYYLGRVGPEPVDCLIDEDPNSAFFGECKERTLPDGTIEIMYPDPEFFPYMSEDIVQYRMKEDWFFDKERSVLDVRIIALAPVVYKIDPNSNSIMGLKEIFWLYFPHCRFVFNNYFVYNDQNDSQWMSYDDLFWKRRFNSVMYKESNTYDRDIESYRMGVDALYESEKIKNEIRLIEHDVWSF
jgi:gliding motility associated protien GldN